jgi:hypothetical protein
MFLGVFWGKGGCAVDAPRDLQIISEQRNPLSSASVGKSWSYELSFFGSVVREDFRFDSDVDVLVTFAPDADWSLLDHVAMEEELSSVLGRKADLVTRKAVERSGNWIRRKAILESAMPYYVAG